MRCIRSIRIAEKLRTAGLNQSDCFVVGSFFPQPRVLIVHVQSAVITYYWQVQRVDSLHNREVVAANEMLDNRFAIHAILVLILVGERQQFVVMV